MACPRCGYTYGQRIHFAMPTEFVIDPDADDETVSERVMAWTGSILDDLQKVTEALGDKGEAFAALAEQMRETTTRWEWLDIAAVDAFGAISDPDGYGGAALLRSLDGDA